MNRRDAIRNAFKGLAFAGLAAVGVKTEARPKKVDAAELTFKIRCDSEEISRHLVKSLRDNGEMREALRNALQ